jgi:hypothetical protein
LELGAANDPKRSIDLDNASFAAAEIMMKIVSLAFVSSLVTSVGASGLGDTVRKASGTADSAAPDAAAEAAEASPAKRELQCTTKYYAINWGDEGHCYSDCQDNQNDMGYATELACCKARFNYQSSGKCLSMLPAPPTESPTTTGGLQIFYPDYSTAWSEATCINTRPMPSGRPTYTSMLACCKGAYGGQMSGACLAALPSPPTESPTASGGLDVWYPNYEVSWTDGECINKRPLPNGRPSYDSQLACCKGAYGGQVSGACLAGLPSPPTESPTATGGLDVWYPNYDIGWTDGVCINQRPLPSGRPTYTSMLACCKGAYGGQTSGACIGDLPSPPTESPTATGGLDVYYPDYENSDWTSGTCINTRPKPAGRPFYDSMLACCKGAYGGQTSGACLAALPSPPTESPTSTGGLDVWYPDYDMSWTEGECINKRPLPNGRPSYDSQLACCKGAYGGQTSGSCLASLPSPPTESPTASGGLDVWYPNYTQTWSSATCINTRPLPSGRPTYGSQMSCCSGAYGGQTSGACICAADPCTSCKCTGTGSWKDTGNDAEGECYASSGEASPADYNGPSLTNCQGS